MDGAYKDMKEYLAKGAKMPTAFFADDDMIALGCIKAFQEAGYRVPEDISSSSVLRDFFTATDDDQSI